MIDLFIMSDFCAETLEWGFSIKLAYTDTVAMTFTTTEC